MKRERERARERHVGHSCESGHFSSCTHILASSFISLSLSSLLSPFLPIHIVCIVYIVNHVRTCSRTEPLCCGHSTYSVCVCVRYSLANISTHTRLNRKSRLPLHHFKCTHSHTHLQRQTHKHIHWMVKMVSYCNKSNKVKSSSYVAQSSLLSLCHDVNAMYVCGISRNIRTDIHIHFVCGEFQQKSNRIHSFCPDCPFPSFTVSTNERLSKQKIVILLFSFHSIVVWWESIVR